VHLRQIRLIKLQVSFAEYCLFYRALLQKRPIVSSILLIEATPYCGPTSDSTANATILEIHEIEKLEFRGTNSNYIKIPI